MVASSDAKTAESRPGAKPLSPEDRARMSRLREEIAGRLEEMGLIVARTLGREEKGHSGLAFLRMKTASGGAKTGFEGTEVIHFPNCQWGCYDHDKGICYPC